MRASNNALYGKGYEYYSVTKDEIELKTFIGLPNTLG